MKSDDKGDFITAQTSDSFALVALQDWPSLPNAFTVDIHAGALIDVENRPDVVQHLLEAPMRFDHGFAWVRTSPAGQASTPAPGKLNFGWRTRVTSNFFDAHGADRCLGVAIGLLSQCEMACKTLRSEIGPAAGGRPMLADEDGWAALVTGALI